MCSIFGFNFEDKSLLKKMSEVSLHRGPDDKGFFSDGNVSLGHNRLSIIDLSERGREPMCNENGDIWLIFNGEIYNFLELRKKLKNHSFYSNTDAEVIIHGYEEYGLKFINELRGMFAFAIYDIKNKKLFLVRDRLGIKPLYYYWKNGELIFASEVKSILEYPIKRSTDYTAFSYYLTFRFIPAPYTMFNNIRKLPPGSILSLDIGENKLEINRYWKIDSFSYKNFDFNFYLNKLKELLSESVKLRLISDVPIGVFLSGGIDSSIIVALMSDLCDDIKTFSIGFNNTEFDETRYARIVSEYFSTNHHEFFIDLDMVKLLPKIIYHLDEPIADPASIPTYVLAEESRKHVKVVLTGEGGDELFGGYEQYKFLKLSEIFNIIPNYILKNSLALFKYLPFGIKKRVFSYAPYLGTEAIDRAIKFIISKNLNEKYYQLISIFTENEKKELNNKFNKYVISKNFLKLENSDHLNQVMLYELKNSLPENLLMKVDKMTMANSLEARVPYLDHKVVELSFKIPSYYKIKFLKEKYILRQSFKDILPKEIINRKKQRFFVPIDVWLKELKNLVEEYLERGIKRGHFNKEYIDKIKHNYSSSPLYYARQIWCLLCFEMWHETFILQEKGGDIWRKKYSTL